MDPRQKEIQAKRREIHELEEQFQSECVEIGARLQAIPSDRLRQEMLVKYVRNMEALVRSQEDLNAQIERIHRLRRDVTDKEQEIEEARTGLTRLSEEHDRLAFDAGAAAYGRLKNLEDPAPYRGHFDAILQIDAEIERLERDLATALEEDKSRGFFGRLVSRGKALGVRSAITKQGKLKLDRFVAAGKGIVRTDLAEKVPALRAIFERAEAARIALEEAKERIRTMEDDLQRLRSELRSMGALQEPEAKLKEIESRVADTNKELALVRLWAGQAFIEQNAHDQVSDPMLRGKATLAGSLQGTLAERRARVQSLQADIELESLAARVRSLAKKREQLESEIRQRKEQIGSLDHEIESLQKRIDQLRPLL